ncbi:MAG: hypothetical protein ACWA5R_14615 [bacterium]
MILKLLTGIKLLLAHPKLVFGGETEVAMTPLEGRLIEELASRLSNKESKTLKSQLSEVNLMERVYAPKTIVSFNKIEGFSYSLKRSDKFRDSEDEYKLMKIDFKVNNKPFRAIFYVVFGNFFSIEFTEDMSSYTQAEVMEFT